MYNSKNFSEFPVETGAGQPASTMTKREFAATIILQGLVSKYNLSKPEDQKTVVLISTQLADELFDTLAKTKTT